MDRLEIKAQTDSILEFFQDKTFQAVNHVINGVNDYVNRYGKNSLSKTDAL